jgi:hypothetical protein
MLKNIPTPDSMEQVSLRLYFTAWGQIVQIIAELLEIENEEEKEKNEPPKYMYDGTPIQPYPWLADKQQFIARRCVACLTTIQRQLRGRMRRNLL